MKPLYQEDIKELTEKLLGLISKSAILMGNKPDAKTLAVLTTHFTKVLSNHQRLRTLTFNQIEVAFEEGILQENQFLSIPTFFRWCKDMKNKIDNAEYEVRTLNKNPKEVPYYQEPKKLLK
jgi:hypothetical protein|tara:strand:- start:701 stop:1063 length:363 start_codon:yes stop_codon:yes gene_type:complete